MAFQVAHAAAVPRRAGLMHVDTTFDGEFAHHGAMAKTARGGVRDQPFVGVDQGPSDGRVIRASRPANRGDPAAQACGPLGGPVGVSNRNGDRLPPASIDTMRGVLSGARLSARRTTIRRSPRPSMPVLTATPQRATATPSASSARRARGARWCRSTGSAGSSAT